MSRVDVILALLDQPTQRTNEPAMLVGREPDCWRCGCSVDNDSRVGACSRCIADLRGERIAHSDDNAPVPSSLRDALAGSRDCILNRMSAEIEREARSMERLRVREASGESGHFYIDDEGHFCGVIAEWRRGDDHPIPFRWIEDDA